MLTSHRLVYLDAAQPRLSSCALDLALIRQTEAWARFLKRSPKIILTIGDPIVAGSTAAIAPAESFEGDEALQPAARSWVCRVCGFSNTPAGKCGLCGVSRDVSSNAVDVGSPGPSRVGTPVSRASVIPSPPPVQAGACPVCTFVNHPSMTRCEICESPLATATVPAPTSRSATPATSSDRTSVRLSFRKGGDREFYAALKSALLAKAWEASSASSAAPRQTVRGIGASHCQESADADRGHHEEHGPRGPRARGRHDRRAARPSGAHAQGQGDGASACSRRC